MLIKSLPILIKRLDIYCQKFTTHVNNKQIQRFEFRYIDDADEDDIRYKDYLFELKDRETGEIRHYDITKLSFKKVRKYIDHIISSDIDLFVKFDVLTGGRLWK